MKHPNPNDQPQSTVAKSKVAEDQVMPLVETPDEKGKSATAKILTPEEQMALYEKDLKENDWGHQPC